MILICCVALAWSADAVADSDGGPVAIDSAGQLPDARIIDIQDEDACTTASLPGARCLPFNNFQRADGQTIGFHALRWLLGTVGLNGEETVLVIGGTTDQVKTVGGLIYQAGQHRVAFLTTPFKSPINATGGEPRSFSREVVFTQAMLDNRLN